MRTNASEGAKPQTIHLSLKTDKSKQICKQTLTITHLDPSLLFTTFFLLHPPVLFSLYGQTFTWTSQENIPIPSPRKADCTSSTNLKHPHASTVLCAVYPRRSQSSYTVATHISAQQNTDTLCLHPATSAYVWLECLFRAHFARQSALMEKEMLPPRVKENKTNVWWEKVHLIS